MSEKRRALGRGLGALIPTAPVTPCASRPVDVFFPDQRPAPRRRSSPGRDGPRRRTAGAPRDGTGEAQAAPAATQASRTPPADAAARCRPSTPGSAESQPASGSRRSWRRSPGAFGDLPSSIRPNPKQPRTVFDEDEHGRAGALDPRDRRAPAGRRAPDSRRSGA